VYHVVYLFLVLDVILLSWLIFNYSPRILSRILPKGLTYGVGITLVLLGIFTAFASAYGLGDPPGLLDSLIQGYFGFWWILGTTSHMRGTREDSAMLRRLLIMMCLLAAALVGTLYIREPRAVAAINLMLVTFGFWVTRNYFQYLDRGR
jgi:hypothetical protein